MRVHELKIFHCLKCDAELALTDGRQLVALSFILVHPARITCRVCGAERFWTPLALGVPDLYAEVAPAGLATGLHRRHNRA